MPTSDRPNILLIFTDQHRLSAVGCYGDTPCQTPSIDRLASEGVRFETAYRDSVHSVPRLQPGTSDDHDRDTIFVEFNGANSLATSMVTVRQGDWKYGWNCSNRDELYNLASDPNEMDNRIDDPGCADQVLHMRRLIETWMVETGYPGPALNMYRHSRIEPLTA